MTGSIKNKENGFEESSLLSVFCALCFWSIGCRKTNGGWWKKIDDDHDFFVECCHWNSWTWFTSALIKCSWIMISLVLFFFLPFGGNNEQDDLVRNGGESPRRVDLVRLDWREGNGRQGSETGQEVHETAREETEAVRRPLSPPSLSLHHLVSSWTERWILNESIQCEKKKVNVFVVVAFLSWWTAPWRHWTLVTWLCARRPTLTFCHSGFSKKCWSSSSKFTTFPRWMPLHVRFPSLNLVSTLLRGMLWTLLMKSWTALRT